MRPHRTARSGRSRSVAILGFAALVVAGCGNDTAGGAAGGPAATDPVTTAPTTTTASTTTTPTSTTTTTTTTTTPTTTTTTTLPPANEECAVIGDDGAPLASTGTTVAALLADLGPAWTSTRDDRYLVDVDGHQFECGGVAFFYGAWSLGDLEEITFVLSDHPSFVDPAGVGPGTLVVDAIAAHGGEPATVGIALENEQREFITFADGGTPGWQYQVRGPEFTRAGIYPESDDTYIETTDFVDGAIIERIWFR